MAQSAFTLGVSGSIKINSQVFTAGGTYTPTVGMQFCVIEVIGSGAGGGSAGATVGSGGGGGGAGEYSRGVFTAADIGASKLVTIGAFGVGAVSSNGTSGATCSVGALITSFGGSGGLLSPSQGVTQGGLGGTGGAGGDFRSPGECGDIGRGQTAVASWGGKGGSSQFGSGGLSPVNNGAGNAAVGFGSGGSGGANANLGVSIAGASGTAGIVIISEFSGSSINAPAVPIQPATKAEQEAGVLTDVYTSPGRQQFHPSASKAWITANSTGGIGSSYNIAGIVDGGVGLITVTIDTDFASADYTIACSAKLGGNVIRVGVTGQVVGSFTARGNNAADGLTDPEFWYFSCFGVQP